MSILIPPDVSVKQGEVALLMVVRCSRETAVSLIETAKSPGAAAVVEQDKLAWLMRLASNLSHQINNPLQIIMGALETYNGFRPFTSESPYLLRLAYDTLQRLRAAVLNLAGFVQESSNGLGEMDILEVRFTGLVNDWQHLLYRTDVTPETPHV